MHASGASRAHQTPLIFRSPPGRWTSGTFRTIDSLDDLPNVLLADRAPLTPSAPGSYE